MIFPNTECMSYSLKIFIITTFLSINKYGKIEYPKPMFKVSKVAKIIYLIFFLFISFLNSSKFLIHIASSKLNGFSPKEQNC